MYRMSWNGKPMASETSSTISKLLCCSRSLRRKYVHLWWTTLSWHGKNCVTSTEKRKYQRRDWRRISYSNSMCNGFCLFLSCVLVFNFFFLSPLCLHNILCAVRSALYMHVIGIPFHLRTSIAHWDDRPVWLQWIVHYSSRQSMET